jgi:hypothetical protein
MGCPHSVGVPNDILCRPGVLAASGLEEQARAPCCAVGPWEAFACGGTILGWDERRVQKETISRMRPPVVLQMKEPLRSFVRTVSEAQARAEHEESVFAN